MDTRADGATSIGRDWLTVVRRRGWVIAEVIVVGVLAGVIGGQLQPERYEAHSELAVYEQGKRKDEAAAPGEQPTISADVQIRMIKGPEVLGKVADRVGVGRTRAALGELQRDIDVRTSKSDSTTMVLIYVERGDAQNASDIANAAADEFVKKCNRDVKLSTTQALEHVKELVKATEEKLAYSEERIKSFKQQESPAAGTDDAGASTRIGNYVGIENRLADVRVELATVRAELANVAKLLKREPTLRELKTTKRNPLGESLHQRIMDLELERVTMLKEYTEDSDELQLLDRRLEALQRELKAEESRVVDEVTEQPNSTYESLRGQKVALETRLASLQAQERALSGLLARRTAEARNLPEDQTEIERMLRERRVQESLYVTLLQQQYGIEVTEMSQPRVADVLQEALPPPAPSKPNRKLYVAFGLIGGILLGLIIAGLVDQLDDTFGDGAEAERLLGIPVLAGIPPAPEAALPLPQLTAPTSPYAEAIRGAVAALQATWGTTPPRTLLVAGPLGGEGTSLFAANLAATLAETGRKVTLVDGNLRMPVLHEYFGLERGPGLTDAITHGMPLGDLLRQTIVPGLSLIPSGTQAANPGAVLGLQRASMVLADLRDVADLVIIDAPPVAPVPDAQLMARSLDAAVLVLARTTKRHAARDAATILQRAGTNLLGMVRNRESAGRAAAHAYGSPETPA